MNQQSPLDSSTPSVSRDDELVSRRAYELWEQEGRPDGCDLRHWLQAEQELKAAPRRQTDGDTDAALRAAVPTHRAPEARLRQGARATAKVSREGKRGSAAPFSGDKSRPMSVTGGK